MRLTDPALPWLIGIGTVAAFVALVAGRPRFRRRGAQAAGRAVTGVLTNLGVIMVGFLVLNDSYVFYSGWGDLFGTDAPAVTTQRGGSMAGIRRATIGTGSAVEPDPAGGRATLLGSHRRLQHYRVRDSASGTWMTVLVALPAGYDPRTARTYPVIIGLHGFPGSPDAFTRVNVLRTAAALTRHHQLAATIVVIPQIDNPASLDTECTNGPPGDPQTDTWLSRELPDWIVTHLRVRTDRQDWATLGYSYGGWCAAELAVRHPARFAAAIDFEGYFRPDFGRGYDPLITATQRRSYDLPRIAGAVRPPVALWVFASRQDPLSYPTTEQFISRVQAPTVVRATIVPTGGHRLTVFEPYVAGSLRWLASSFRGFGG